jgi:hypothetical protein
LHGFAQGIAIFFLVRNIPRTALFLTLFTQIRGS